MATQRRRSRRDEERPKGSDEPLADSIRRGLMGRKHRYVGTGLAFADDLLVLQGDGAESPEEFDRLLQALRGDLCPRGILEEVLVEAVTSCVWRKKRLLRFERGTLEQAQIRARLDYFESRVRCWSSGLGLGLGADEDESSVDSCSRSPEGIDRLLDLIDTLRAEIEETGHLSEDSMSKVWLTWRKDDRRPDGVGFWAYVFNSQLTGEHPMEEELDEEGCRTGLLGILDAERERLEAVKVLAIEELEARAEALIDSLSIPDLLTVKRTEEYRATVDREMYAALEQLERLQRARLGDLAYTIMRFAATADEAEPQLAQKVGELRLTVSSPIKAPRIGPTRSRAR